MPLAKLLRSTYVEPGLVAPDKWEAIRHLCRRVVAEGHVSPDALDALVEAVFARERSLSTGLEKGVAVPHAFVVTLPRPCLVFGLAPGGIPFESLDGRPAEVIALLVAPATDAARRDHLQALAQLSGFLLSPGTLDALPHLRREADVLTRLAGWLETGS